MNKFIIYILFGLFFHITTYAENNESVHFENLFSKAEKKAIEQRIVLENKRVFIDPLKMNNYSYNIFLETSPELLKNTSVYVDSLLLLFNNRFIEKDYYTDFDILMILCNLCIDDYVILIEKSFALYKNDELRFEIFRRIIIQNNNISNLVIKNYRNNKLQTILLNIQSKIKEDHNIIPNNSQIFIDDLQNILSGRSWREFEQLGDKPLIDNNCQ